MNKNSDSYIIITCDDGAVPRLNRLQLRTSPPSFIDLQSGENTLSIKDYPDLKYGFRQIEDGFRQIEDCVIKDSNEDNDTENCEYNCESVRSIDLSHFDSSKVTQMNNMFERMAYLNHINFGSIRFKNITSIAHAFDWVNAGPGAHNGDLLDLSKIDFSQILDTTEMFYGCCFDTVDLTGCDMSNIESADNMFYICGIHKLILDGSKLSSAVIEAITSESREWDSLEEVSLKRCDINIIASIIFGLTFDRPETWKSIKFILDKPLWFDIRNIHGERKVLIYYNHVLLCTEDYNSRLRKHLLSNHNIIPYLSETPSLRNYPTTSKPFLNPFEKSTEKYNMFQGTPLQFLIGLKPIEDIVPYFTPTLPLGALISQLEQIRDTIFAMNYDLNSEMKLLSIQKAIENVEIFLVTTENEKQSHFVHNLFKNGEREVMNVPESRSICEGGFDALGKYISQTGSIYLWVDKIYRYRTYPLVFQTVLLHELIHLCFDIIRKGLILPKSNKDYSGERIDEETIDNCLLLHCYSQATSPFEGVKMQSFNEVITFVKNQPQRYRNGENMFNQTKVWGDMRAKLINFFKQQTICVY